MAAADWDAVRASLGRDPTAAFEVVVRDPSGAPVVLRNAPLTDDGVPMPTRYWLCDPTLTRQVARLEAAGYEFKTNEGGGRRVLFVVDPAGNRWELIGASA